MKIAIPIAQGVLAAHFGHCEKFALVDVEVATAEVRGYEEVDAPQHQPGLFPRWLASLGAEIIIAGGMGARAQQLFAANRITVVTGAASKSPRAVVSDYMAGNLATAPDPCTGGHGDCDNH